jgi:hypothetical protein
MANSQFNSPATLVGDGTVAVEGGLGIDPEGLLSPEVEFRFLLVQGDLVVQGRGQGTAGGWRGKTLEGQPSLEEGDALAIGLAVATRQEPPGYETFTWVDQIRLAP